MKYKIQSQIGLCVWAKIGFNYTKLSRHLDRNYWTYTLKNILKDKTIHQPEVILNPHQAEPAPIPYEIEFNLQ